VGRVLKSTWLRARQPSKTIHDQRQEYTAWFRDIVAMPADQDAEWDDVSVFIPLPNHSLASSS